MSSHDRADRRESSRRRRRATANASCRRRSRGGSDRSFARSETQHGATSSVWSIDRADSRAILLREAQTVTDGDGRTLVNGQPLGRRRRDQTCIRSAGSADCRRKQDTGPLGPLEFFRTLQDSEVVLWTKVDVERTRTAPTTTVYTPEADARVADPPPGRASQVRRHSRGGLHPEAQLPVADAGPVLRDGVAAAYSHSLLHGQGRGGRPQEHDRRHREHRLLLCADAVSRSGGDDQRSDGRHRQQHGRPAAGQEHERTAVRDHLGDRLHDGAGDGQRTDSGLCRGGEPRSAQERVRHAR